jgi:hypothetical protein
VASPVREAFLDAAAAARTMLARPVLAARWDEPSALPQMPVGALAGHLARTTLVVTEYLDAAPPSGEPLATAAEYFLRNGVGPDLESTANVAIRGRAANTAQRGANELLDAYDAAAAALRDRLEDEAPDRAVRVASGVPMLLDEYLITRIVELIVHSDDLACTLGVAAPEFTPVSTACAIECLLEMARLRHGDLAVVRAMTRRERDGTDVLRVF